MRPIPGLPSPDRRRTRRARLRAVGEGPRPWRSPRRRRAVSRRPLQLLPRRGRARSTSIRPSMAVVFPGAPIGVAAVLVQATAVRGRRPCREQDRHGCSQHCSGHLSPRPPRSLASQLPDQGKGTSTFRASSRPPLATHPQLPLFAPQPGNPPHSDPQHHAEHPASQVHQHVVHPWLP